MTRRKRLAITIALVLVCVLSLFSCSSVPATVDSSTETTAEAATDTVQALAVLGSIGYGKFGHQDILYDPETKVMYVLIINGEGAAMSPLYNPDGTLKLYNH